MRYFLWCLLFLPLISLAQGNVQRGQGLSKQCVACHGPDGNSPIPSFPKIAGQNENYFIKQMLAYKSGKSGPRYNLIMSPLASQLSTQDIEDLAAYYAVQKTSLGAADPKLVTRGQQLYRAGDVKNQIPACSACHGPRGRGLPEAGFPYLSGQHAEYIVARS